MNKRTVGIVYVIASIATALILLLPYILALVTNPVSIPYVTIPESAEFEFDRVYDISASSASPSSYVTLNTAKPHNPNTIGNVQSVTATRTQPSSLPTYITETPGLEGENSWTSWNVSPAQDFSITVHYDGSTTAKVWDISTDDSGTVNDIPSSLKGIYLNSEFITSGTSTIRLIDPDPFENSALQETTGETSVVGKLRLIYDTIVNEMTYQTTHTGAPKSAVETWNDKAGDCDELSAVFCSIARSIDIPAWIEYGFLYNGETFGPHAWVQTYVPLKNGGYEYVNIDLTVEVGRENYGRGFLMRDANRFTEWVDDGDENHLDMYYHYLSYGRASVSPDTAITNVEYTPSSEQITIPSASFTIPNYVILLIIALVAIFITYSVIRTVPKSRPQKVMKPKVLEPKEEIKEEEIFEEEQDFEEEYIDEEYEEEYFEDDELD